MLLKFKVHKCSAGFGKIDIPILSRYVEKVFSDLQMSFVCPPLESVVLTVAYFPKALTLSRVSFTPKEIGLETVAGFPE